MMILNLSEFDQTEIMIHKYLVVSGLWMHNPHVKYAL